MVNLDSKPNLTILMLLLCIILQGIAIFAFATTAGYYSEYKVSSSLRQGHKCNQTLFKVIGKFEYPFDDGTIYTSNGTDFPEKCISNVTFHEKTALDITAKHKSEAQFFVFTGVLTFLYCLFACVYYAMMENPAESMYSTDVGMFSWVVMVSIGNCSRLCEYFQSFCKSLMNVDSVN